MIDSAADLACVVAGCVAVGAVAFHHNQGPHGIHTLYDRFRGAATPGDAQALPPPSAVSAKVAGIASPEQGAPPTEASGGLAGGDLTSLDTAANEQHLAQASKTVMSNLKKYNTARMGIKPTYDFQTTDSAAVGGFMPRLGDTQVFHSQGKLPRQTRCDTVGLPMNDFQANVYESEHGTLPGTSNITGRAENAQATSFLEKLF